MLLRLDEPRGFSSEGNCFRHAVALLLAAAACSVDDRQVATPTTAAPSGVGSLMSAPADPEREPSNSPPPSAGVDDTPTLVGLDSSAGGSSPTGTVETVPPAMMAGAGGQTTVDEVTPPAMTAGAGGQTALDEVTLTLSAGSNGAFGRVTTVATGLLACTQPPCSLRMPRGTSLVLRAQTGYDGSGFAGWQAGPCSGLEDCTLRLDADTSVVASYAPANLVFVTSTRMSGSLGGAAQADALCAARAVAAGLSGTFRAWVSDSGSNAIDALSGSRGWVRPDGFPVVDSASDLVDGGLFYPIQVDEAGRNVGAGVVWTGTGNGGRIGLETCQNWSIGTTGGIGTVGRSELVGFNFSTLPAVSCNTQAPIYCFGVGQNVAVAPIPVEGRRAFVTEREFFVAGGLAAADATCQRDAATFALTGSYKAVLNTSTQSAASRFNLSGPAWIRLDGMRLSATASEFFAGPNWLTAVNLTPAGFFGSGYSIWAGGSSLLLPGTLATTCNDWTSVAGSATTGLVSGTTPSSYFYFNPTGTPCDARSLRLACLEE